MPFWRFTVLTTLGCIPWILMLTLIGREVGDNWEKWKDSLHYVDYAVAAAIVLGLLVAPPAPAPRRARRAASRPPMRRTEREALALGLLHGPVELVPVSSSGHVAAVPWLLGWEVAGWDGERRKELEVALHAGTALALLLVARPARLRPGLLAAAVLPPALAGLALERRIEQRLGTPVDARGGAAGGRARARARRPGASRRGARRRPARATAPGSASPRRPR